MDVNRAKARKILALFRNEIDLGFFRESCEDASACARKFREVAIGSLFYLSRCEMSGQRSSKEMLLHGAKLRGKCLTGPNLSSSILGGSNLSYTGLHGRDWSAINSCRDVNECRILLFNCTAHCFVLWGMFKSVSIIQIHER
jgi:uncharacterized protein YjbI with pentapeptide repeats